MTWRKTPWRRTCQAATTALMTMTMPAIRIIMYYGGTVYPYYYFYDSGGNGSSDDDDDAGD
jgi:hypothetical protein